MLLVLAESPEGSCAAAGGLQAWDFAPRSHQQRGERKKPFLRFYCFVQPKNGGTRWCFKLHLQWMHCCRMVSVFPLEKSHFGSLKLIAACSGGSLGPLQLNCQHVRVNLGRLGVNVAEQKGQQGVCKMSIEKL